MIKKSELLKKTYYKPKYVANLIGVTPKSVTNYCDKGLLDCIRNEGGFRYITQESLITYLEAKNMLMDDTLSNKHDIIYARVSTYKQKERGDLDRQVQYIKEFLFDKKPNNVIVLAEVGSGLNDNRKKLNKLIDLILRDKVSRVFINYKDRLTRFGFNYLKQLCDFKNVEIIVVSDDLNDKSMQEELAEDIIAIIHSFSGKLYGMRHKVIKKATEILNVGEDYEK